jgi:hypothetical protein
LVCTPGHWAVHPAAAAADGDIATDLLTSDMAYDDCVMIEEIGVVPPFVMSDHVPSVTAPVALLSESTRFCSVCVVVFHLMSPMKVTAPLGGVGGSGIVTVVLPDWFAVNVPRVDVPCLIVSVPLLTVGWVADIVFPEIVILLPAVSFCW